MDKMNMLKQDGPVTVFKVENDTGTAKLTNWKIYPGITLSYIDAKIQKFSCYAPLRPNVFAINHCEKGRIECNFKNGEYLYMSEGDMAVGRRSSSAYLHTVYFPSNHYHGLSILVNTKAAQRVVDSLLDTESFGLNQLCDRFCRDSEFGIIVQENEAMKHLFYEFYHVPADIRHRYFRIKVLETLLFLSAYKGELRPDRPYLTYQQVHVVKDIHRKLEQNIYHHCTIDSLASDYGISATTLKRCFKEVYGMTMHQYQRGIRLEEAKKLLANSEKTVLEIAQCIGYENGSKFAASFKRATGMLPKDYRKQIQKNNQSVSWLEKAHC